MIINCDNCSKEFKTLPSYYKRAIRHYCSRDCSFVGTRASRTANILRVGKKTRFSKTYRPDPSKKMPKGPDNYAWKGERVGYRGLHYWVRRMKGIPSICTECGATKSVQWANIDGQYRRDPADYIALCASCHKIKDLSISDAQVATQSSS